MSSRQAFIEPVAFEQSGSAGVFLKSATNAVCVPGVDLHQPRFAVSPLAPDQ